MTPPNPRPERTPDEHREFMSNVQAALAREQAESAARGAEFARLFFAKYADPDPATNSTDSTDDGGQNA